MIVAILAAALGFVVVLLAFYRDEPLPEDRLAVPDWGLLPEPSDLSRVEFPLAFPGYDPATVEFHFDLVVRAYGDLLAAATPDVIARARSRAALRRGVEPDAVLDPSPPPTVAPAPPENTSLTPLVVESGDVEALRAEAALAQLDAPHAVPPPEPRP